MNKFQKNECELCGEESYLLDKSTGVVHGPVVFYRKVLDENTVAFVAINKNGEKIPRWWMFTPWESANDRSMKYLWPVGMALFSIATAVLSVLSSVATSSSRAQSLRVACFVALSLFICSLFGMFVTGLKNKT